ncbi:MAG TPA: YbaY family lipoprotein [Rubricoccaceae bacterium]|jgi:putative lipoprotein
MRLALPLLVFVAGCGVSLPRTPLTPAEDPVPVPGVPAAAADASAVLNGTITSPTPLALPPGATVRVRVEDVSLADAPARVVSEQTFGDVQLEPIPFALPYRPSTIDVRSRYAVHAEIRDAAGALLWTTTTHTPVFTQGGPIDGVAVIVEQVRP